MSPPEMEEDTKLDASVTLDKAGPGQTSRRPFDWPNFVPIATLVLGVAGFLWLSIQNIDDDVDQLSETVRTLAGDVVYIKGRLESIPVPTRATGNVEPPMLLSHVVGDATFP